MKPPSLSLSRIRYQCRSRPCFAMLTVLQAFFFSPPAMAQDSSSSLTIVANGFKEEQGHAIARLFRPGVKELKKSDEEIVASINKGQAQFTFPHLAAGDYAVVVFHDANDNGAVDHNFFGIPVETLGFSNGWAISLSSGMPSFDKLRFVHGKLAQTIYIKVE